MRDQSITYSYRSCASPIRIGFRVRVQRFGSIVADRFHNAQPFRPSLPEQYPIAHGQVLRPLHKSECHGCPVARSYERPVNVDDGAGLADRAYMQHGLIFCFDSGCVREDEYFRDEFSVHFGRSVEFGEYHHAFPYFFSSDPFQCEGSRLAGTANRNRDPFPFNRADMGCGELAKGVRPNQDSIAGMDDATFDNPGHDRADEGYGESVIDVELERGFCIVISVMRKDIEEGPYEVERLTGDV